MHKTTSSNNNHLSERFRKICLLVYLFVSDRSKWIFPAEMGISHSRKDVQYSSAQHDTLKIDNYSFWYTTESGEKKEFLYCTHDVKSIIINGVFAEENPDANTLIRLSKAINAAEAEFIYEHLEKMFVFGSNGHTVDQYLQQRCEYWRSSESLSLNSAFGEH